MRSSRKYFWKCFWESGQGFEDNVTCNFRSHKPLYQSLLNAAIAGIKHNGSHMSRLGECRFVQVFYKTPTGMVKSVGYAVDLVGIQDGQWVLRNKEEK